MSTTVKVLRITYVILMIGLAAMMVFAPGPWVIAYAGVVLAVLVFEMYLLKKDKST